MSVMIHLNGDTPRHVLVRKALDALYDVMVNAVQTEQDCMDVDGGSYADGLGTGRSRQAGDAMEIVADQLGSGLWAGNLLKGMRVMFKKIDPSFDDEGDD